MNEDLLWDVSKATHGILGQTLGVVIYSRNLWLIRHQHDPA